MPQASTAIVSKCPAGKTMPTLVDTTAKWGGGVGGWGVRIRLLQPPRQQNSDLGV